MKKIAIVSSAYAYSLWSGLGRHTFYLAFALAKRNYDVSVFTFAPGGKTFKSQDSQVSITRIGVASGEDNSLPIEALDEWNAKVLVELRKQDFEVVLLPTCHGWDSAKELGCRVVGFVPFVYGFTGWSTRIGNEVKNKMLKLEQDFLLNCHELICHNEQFGNRVAQHANKPVYVLPNNYLDLAETKALNIEKTPNSILCVGKINKEKSVETIIRALALMPVGHLTLCYPENSDLYIPKIKKLAIQLRVDKRVHCKGWLPPTELKALYARSEITATPSFHEPYGYPVIDPMAMGSIPLVSDWSGLGAYVTPEETFNSIESMAKKMLIIFDKTKEQKQAMEHYNMEKIRYCYSSDAVTNQLEQIMRGQP